MPTLNNSTNYNLPSHSLTEMKIEDNLPKYHNISITLCF